MITRQYSTYIHLLSSSILELEVTCAREPLYCSRSLEPLTHSSSWFASSGLWNPLDALWPLPSNDLSVLFQPFPSSNPQLLHWCACCTDPALLFPRCPYQELVDSGSWVADNMFTDSDPVYPGLCWLGPVYCVWQTWFRVGANLDCHPLSSPLADSYRPVGLWWYNTITNLI